MIAEKMCELGRGLEVDPKALQVDVEPWMRDFVKERHSKEEWEAFFQYSALSPWKRGLCRVYSAIARIFS